jgi:hypothetical protein
MKISEVVDRLINYDTRVIFETLEYFLNKETSEPFNKRIHAIIILDEINVLTSCFSIKYPSRLTRPNKLPIESFILALIDDILSDISNLSILDYAPTYPKSSEELEQELLIGLEMMRSVSSVEIDRFIQRWSDALLYKHTFDNPPKRAKNLFENAKSEINSKFIRDYGIDPEYLTALDLVFKKLEHFDEEVGRNPTDPRNVDAEVIKKYESFVWDKDRFLTSNIKYLIICPPFFIKSGTQYSTIALPGFTYLIDSYKFQQWIAINKMHSDCRGDASELVIKDFLTKKSLEFDGPNITFPEKKKSSHADWCEIRKEIKKNNKAAEDLFCMLDESQKTEPQKTACEIDVIARNQDTLLVGEIKISSSYDNVCEYYYSGTYKKAAECKRLKSFYFWFSKNIDKLEKLLDLPSLNGVKRCIPIFITNQTGDIIRDNDGILKVTPLDVMFTEHFKELVDKFDIT